MERWERIGRMKRVEEEGGRVHKEKDEEEEITYNKDSAFNTIVPSKLVTKLRDLRTSAQQLNSALCDWILNFLTGRPQAVRMGSTTSSTLTLNTGAPRAVCSALCCTPCSRMTAWPPTAPTPSSNLLTTHDRHWPDHRRRRDGLQREVRALTSWCQDNNLQLNVSKTKELIVDFRRRQREEHAPLSINGTTVERVKQLQVPRGSHQ
ncbi:hypothetical protein L3Q82_026106 [Scortum barcoo]|uniref:Uncharacterized protein n=1 Tax=Scortum barcoo TaxID=214431 RepID=A0ACB8WME8_9TELE|nr:hypothetical protein L3Q82_026106 [Scortum barcoo]